MSRARNPWLVLTALVIGQVSTLMDTTVVNVAIPTLTRELSASIDAVLWVVNGYVLSYAVLLVIGGRLGDLYGQRRVFVIGVVSFTIASVLCGLAQNVEQLIVFRVLQGVGAALLTPQVLSMLVAAFPEERRGSAFGVFTAVGGLAGAIGPTVGGLLIDSVGWRWIFYVNIPLGIAAGVFGLLWLPKDGVRVERRLDVLGTVLVTLGLFLITFALIEGQRHDWDRVWGPVTITHLIVGGIGVLGLFVLVERGRQDREPLLPFAVVRNRNFTLMALVVTALPLALGAMLLLTLLHLQAVVGMSARGAGLAIALSPVVLAVVAPASGRLIEWIGAKALLVSGFVLYALGILAIAMVIGTATTGWELVPGLVLVGIGGAVTGTPLAMIAMRDIGPEVVGAASGLFSTTRLAGSLIGSAAVGAMLQARLSEVRIDPDLVTAGQIPSGSREGFAEAIQATYLLPAIALVAGALLALAAKNTGAVQAPPEPAAELSAAES